MKRLKKKAWGTITLYHGTTMQYFMEMMNSGQILPGGYTGKVSGGGYMSYMSLADENDQTTGEYRVEEHDVSTLCMYIDNKDLGVVLDEGLKTKLLELKKQFPSDSDLMDQLLYVRVSNPSGNQIGIYLGKNEGDVDVYLRNWSKGTDNSKPNGAMILKLNVEEDALGPDLDDGSINERDKTPYWKQTLDGIGQCVHNGPISIDSISQIKIPGNKFNTSKINSIVSDMDAEEWGAKYIAFDTWIDANTAFSQITTMFQDYQNVKDPYDDDVVASRLKRIINKAGVNIEKT